MTYYVYKNDARKGRRAHTGHAPDWILVAEFGEYHKAVVAAEKLCPRGCTIHSEPGDGMPQCFFGSTAREFWSAMITRIPK